MGTQRRSPNRESVIQIDTEAIRRLRDALLVHPGAAEPALYEDPSGEVERALLRRVEPFAETMFLVMVSDGDRDPSERDALVAAFEILTDGGVPRPRIDTLIAEFGRRLALQGAEARLAQIGALIGSERERSEIAFTLAAAMALADDRIDVRENQALVLAQQYLGVSDRRMAVLLESVD